MNPETSPEAMMDALRNEIPEVVEALEGLHDVVMEDGALPAKTKSLILVGISAAIRCEPCIRKHVRGASELGATRSEIIEAAGTAILLLSDYIDPLLTDREGGEVRLDRCWVLRLGR